MSSSRTTLEAATEDRKSRLAQLKSLKRKQAPTPESDSARQNEDAATDEPPRKRTRTPTPPTDVTSTYLSGRNYDVATRGPKLGFESAPNKGSSADTLESKAQAIEAETRRQREEEERADKPLDLFKLQPKRPNWDLKRDLEKKYEVLSVRTENAIARAVRERLAKAKEEAKLKKTANGDQSGTVDEEGHAIGMEGAALVEATREMEREDQEDEARRRRAVDGDDEDEEGVGHTGI